MQSSMGLFGKKETKNTETAPAVKETAQKTAAPKLSAGRNLASVILKPRITEKAALSLDKNVYTFEVHKNATKYDVSDTIKALYNVTPVKVHIVQNAPRTSMSRARGRKITHKGLKKAYVYLKKGDRIDLV